MKDSATGEDVPSSISSPPVFGSTESRHLRIGVLRFGIRFCLSWRRLKDPVHMAGLAMLRIQMRRNTRDQKPPSPPWVTSWLYPSVSIGLWHVSACCDKSKPGFDTLNEKAKFGGGATISKTGFGGIAVLQQRDDLCRFDEAAGPAVHEE